MPLKLDLPILKPKGENFETWRYQFEAYCRLNNDELLDVTRENINTSIDIKVEEEYTKELNTFYLEKHPYLNPKKPIPDYIKKNERLLCILITATSGEAAQLIRHG